MFRFNSGNLSQTWNLSRLSQEAMLRIGKTGGSRRKKKKKKTEYSAGRGSFYLRSGNVWENNLMAIP